MNINIQTAARLLFDEFHKNSWLVAVGVENGINSNLKKITVHVRSIREASLIIPESYNGYTTQLISYK